MTPNESSSTTSSPVSVTDTAPGNPTVLPSGMMSLDELKAFRMTPEGKKLVTWVLNEFSRCKTARQVKERVWYTNMSFTLGHQWIETVGKALPNSVAGKMITKKSPRYLNRRTANRIRAFVRADHSKFLSTLPVFEAIPASGEDEDTASAQAAEQVLESYVSRRLLRREYAKAEYWKIITGVGFMKEWWDPTIIDPHSGQPGDIVYKSITPFHLFVPDLRENELDDQPYVIHAQVKNIEWVKQYYAAELEGNKLEPSTVSANTLLDEAYLNLSNSPRSDLDSVVIYEMWVRPGQNPLLPNGGWLVIVENTLVALRQEGLPYAHGQYPYTKFDYLFNDAFYADSPLVDLIPLQMEYNDWRTDISLAAKRMGRPQLLYQKGSLDPNKLTNEPGLAIPYNQGFQPPTQIQPAPLPEYVMTIPDRVLQDFEDISGQHEVSRGDAPPGVTAGTAISFLQEKDDQYLTPQYQNIEDGFQRIAIQTLSLFQQYVDVARAVKVVGRDQSFDTVTLSGADIAGGTDVRVEPGSSIGQSMAAKRATIMDMFGMGIIQDPNQALQMLEIGGAQRILSVIDAARKKANRENMKFRLITEKSIQENRSKYGGIVLSDMMKGTGGPDVPPEELDVDALLEAMRAQPGGAEIADQIEQMIPPVVQVDDFDDDATHIQEHNRFRMGQEYETWPDFQKEQMSLHVRLHEERLAEQMFEQMQMQMGGPAGPPGSMGGEEEAPPPEGV